MLRFNLDLRRSLATPIGFTQRIRNVALNELRLIQDRDLRDPFACS